MSITLSEVRAHALALPEVTEEPHHERLSLRVRGKIFATFEPCGDHLHLFVSEEIRERALADSKSACEVLLWGKKVAGLRMNLQRTDASRARQLLTEAWFHKAPKSLRPPT